MRKILMASAALLFAGLAPAAAWVDTLPGSSSFLISPDEAAALDCYDLWHARNEIYARHGYQFLSAEARDEFGSTGWTRNPAFSQIEQKNIATIQKFEKIHGCS